MDEPTETRPTESSDSGRAGARYGRTRQYSLWQSTLGGNFRLPRYVPPRYMSELNKYERLIVFAESLPPNEARDLAADRIRASFETISLVATPDYRTNNELFQDLEAFCKTVVNTPRWYTYGNIFNFSDLHLEQLLDSRRFGGTIHDPEHFVEHLKNYLRPSSHNFVQKIGVIVRALCTSQNGPLRAFDLLAYILTTSRWLDPSTKTGIRHLMQTLLEKYMGDGVIIFDSTHIPVRNVSRFLDYPAACRHLRAATGGFKSKGVTSSPLLQMLETEAWRRSRLQVYLVCSSRLPVELVEAVFEHVLRKESVPLKLSS